MTAYLTRLVYLRVQEVCDLVAQLLPGGRGETQEKLAQVEAELAELDAVHAELFYQLVAFSYFMFMRHNFDLGPIRDFWAKRYKTKRIKQLNFDADRYALLKRLQQRYQRHLTN
ncbi:MCU domain-containing protein [Haematococcus lacustris]|uniref:MCU domain-containing protein n=1 Tax=Haematococcus lacustris TaxID=44745 RepID=A0A699Z9B7_HAELA|nr:MCU domain-containing protein [Haematococcus lacustris]